jgi:hypothetical protein
MITETREEAAQNYLNRVADGKRTTGYADEDFIEGVKWEAERTRNAVIEELKKFVVHKNKPGYRRLDIVERIKELENESHSR